MPDLSPQEFVAKWRQTAVKERSGTQEHFIDLCRLVGHPTPVEDDPTGTRFTFESSHGRWADEVHLPLALFVTPVDREPSGNSFPGERPEWAPFHPFPE